MGASSLGVVRFGIAQVELDIVCRMFRNFVCPGSEAEGNPVFILPLSISLSCRFCGENSVV